MSTKTSHRRLARHQRSLDQFIVQNGLTAALDTRRVCRGRCQSQCDECHDIDNCVEATTRYADLLLCRGCRVNHPAVEPWTVCPETGEFVNALTGEVV